MLILLAGSLFAVEYKFFTPERFGKPFVSDMYSSVIKFEEGFINDLGELYHKPDYHKRPVSEGRVGTDIPFLSYYKKLQKGHIKSTLLITGSFNIILDSLEPTTRMVINTDYWLGSELRSVIYHPSIESLGIRNLGLIIVPMYHESTHLGDEFVMEGINLNPDFYRVNVSYEAWKVALTINDPDTLKGNLLSARIGIQRVWFAKDGYYQYNLLETQGQDLLPGKDVFSYWLQVNWRRTQGLGASELFHQINAIELRNRVKYGYFANDPEARRWNINAYFGWEYQSKSQRKVGAYLRLYHGINPHGQLRNIDDFYFVGLAVVLM